jgi:hypothetical protein
MIVQRALEKKSVPGPSGSKLKEVYEVEISNANPYPLVAETVFRLPEQEWRLVRPSRKLKAGRGGRVWRAKVPANGRATLTYTMELLPPPAPKTRLRADKEAGR